MAADRDLDFGMKCIKYMLFVANFMFLLVGLLLLSIGYTIKAIYNDFEQFMEAHYYSPSILAIVVGFIIIIIALFGCVGAVKESTFLVNAYAFMLTVVLILEIAVSLAAYSMRSNITTKIKENMDIAMDNYDDSFNAYTWNATQYNLQCCGIYDPKDWTPYAKIKGFNLTTVTLNSTVIYVPETCCSHENCTTGRLYVDGCLHRLSFVVSQCALLLGVGALCVSFIQLLGIIFAHMLAKSIRKLKTQLLVEREQRRRNFYEQMVQSELGETKSSPVLYTPSSSDA